MRNSSNKRPSRLVINTHAAYRAVIRVGRERIRCPRLRRSRDALAITEKHISVQAFSASGHAGFSHLPLSAMGQGFCIAANCAAVFVAGSARPEFISRPLASLCCSAHVNSLRIFRPSLSNLQQPILTAAQLIHHHIKRGAAIQNGPLALNVPQRAAH